MTLLLAWMNVNKSYLALVAVVLLQLAAANHWLIVPPEVLNTLSAFAAGAGVGLIRHSTAAAIRGALPK